MIDISVYSRLHGTLIQIEYVEYLGSQHVRTDGELCRPKDGDSIDGLHINTIAFNRLVHEPG